MGCSVCVALQLGRLGQLEADRAFFSAHPLQAALSFLTAWQSQTRETAYLVSGSQGGGDKLPGLFKVWAQKPLSVIWSHVTRPDQI